MLSEPSIGFKAMGVVLPAGGLKSTTCLSTALDRLNMGQSASRQQLGIAAFSGEGLASQWDAILYVMAAFAMTGAAVVARTATTTPARIDLNRLTLIYIIIIQA